MLILGVDPGITNLGYGIVSGDRDPVLVDFGCLVIKRSTQRAARLLEIFDGIERVFDRHAVTAVAIEQTIFARNVSTANAVAQAAGIVMLAAARREIEVSEYSPPQIKNAVTGAGNADKRQVQEMVKIILKLQAVPEPDHAADALAAAICHIHNHRLNSILARASR